MSLRQHEEGFYLVMQTLPYRVLRLNRDEEVTGYHLGIPAKGTVVTQVPIPTHGNRPCGLQENADLTEESLLACPPRPQLHSCPGQTGPTLVDELVERMLAIGPWLPPHNGARLVVHTGAGLGDVYFPLDSMSPWNGARDPVIDLQVFLLHAHAPNQPGMHQARLPCPGSVRYGQA